jgi:hypothetical protein
MLWVKQETLTADIYSPACLQLLAVPDDVTVITNMDGSLRQVGARQCLADIAVISSGQSYQVAFYLTNGLVPGHDGETLLPTNGLATEVLWTIDNPDVNASNRVRIVETRGVQSLTNIFTWNAVSNSWELLSGNGLRKELLTKAWDTSHVQRTETRQVINPASGVVVEQTAEKYQTFDWGEGLMERVEGDGSASVTNLYEYSATGQQTAVTNGDGSWQRFTYDGARVSTIESSLGDWYSKYTYYYYGNLLESYGDNPD